MASADDSKEQRGRCKESVCLHEYTILSFISTWMDYFIIHFICQVNVFFFKWQFSHVKIGDSEKSYDRKISTTKLLQNLRTACFRWWSSSVEADFWVKISMSGKKSSFRKQWKVIVRSWERNHRTKLQIILSKDFQNIYKSLFVNCSKGDLRCICWWKGVLGKINSKVNVIYKQRRKVLHINM